MKNLSSAKIAHVLSLLDNGSSYSQIHQRTGVSIGSISALRLKYRPNLPRPSAGRPAHLSASDARQAVRLVTGTKSANATQAAKELSKSKGVHIHPKTVQRRLRSYGLKAITKPKAPLLTSAHIKARLDFALQYQDWTIEDWKYVIWSDETKINRLGSDGRTWAWKKPGEPLSSRLVRPVKKFGGGSLMMWGCMCWEGVGFATKIEGRMDGPLYVQILRDELMQTLEYYGKEVDEVIFQQDNDSKHTSKVALKCFQELGLRVLSWPANSPDLNPIEHLWFILKRRLNDYPEPPKGMLELWERVQVEWEAISKEQVQKLIISMADRIQAVIRSKGDVTDY